jgi:hypothetical protein
MDFVQGMKQAKLNSPFLAGEGISEELSLIYNYFDAKSPMNS